MFKLLGALVVIMASGLIGMSKYNELFERKRILTMLYDGANKTKNNLKCMCMPIYENFLMCGGIYDRAAKLMAEGKTPCDAVTEGIAGHNFLKKEDRCIILRFARGLSASNCDGQIRNTELFITELEKSIQDASKELESKGKLYIKGSILASAAFVLVII